MQYIQAVIKVIAMLNLLIGAVEMPGNGPEKQAKVFEALNQLLPDEIKVLNQKVDVNKVLPVVINLIVWALTTSGFLNTSSK